MIDIIVGMQYGDEGKGASAVMLDMENRYDFAVRTGGSQAEHRFRYGPRFYRMRVLPCIAAIRPDVPCFLAGGMVIRPDILATERLRYNIRYLTIDAGAPISVARDRDESKQLGLYERRGGYGMGISPALIAKIRRDGTAVLASSIFPGETSDVSRDINELVKMGKHGLIEASQGALLSLTHGDYPHTTSYDVTAPAVMNAAGIGIKAVRHVYGVVRCYPMRVAGNSGPLPQETSFDEIERKSGAKIADYRRQQTNEDNTPYGEERIGKFDLRDFRKAANLNTPDSIILTHTDWTTPDELEYITQAIHDEGYDISYTRHGEQVRDYVKKRIP